MKQTKSILRAALPASLFLVPLSAHAHHAEAMSGQPFLQGISMPLHGIDHLLSALAVGLIAARAKDGMRIKLPLLFAFVALLGGFLNLGGITLPEIAVPLTVAAAGILLWRGLSAVSFGTALVALAGLTNGQALIEVAPTTFSAGILAAGCILSALSVCALGLGLGRVFQTHPQTERFAGATLLLGAALVSLFPALNAAVIHCIE